MDEMTTWCPALHHAVGDTRRWLLKKRKNSWPVSKNRTPLGAWPLHHPLSPNGPLAAATLMEY